MKSLDLNHECLNVQGRRLSVLKEQQQNHAYQNVCFNIGTFSRLDLKLDLITLGISHNEIQKHMKVHKTFLPEQVL